MKNKISGRHIGKKGIIRCSGGDKGKIRRLKKRECWQNQVE